MQQDTAMQNTAIIRWREYQPYVPVQCIHLPPEIIYMIAKLAPREFMLVAHEYFDECHEAAKRAHFYASIRYIWVPLETWFNREAKLTIPYAYMTFGQRYIYIDPTATLRYAT